MNSFYYMKVGLNLLYPFMTQEIARYVNRVYTQIWDSSFLLPSFKILLQPLCSGSYVGPRPVLCFFRPQREQVFYKSFSCSGSHCFMPEVCPHTKAVTVENSLYAVLVFEVHIIIKISLFVFLFQYL